MPAESVRLLTLALDPRVLTAEDPLSQRILDAALSLAAASGLRNLTMDDAARRAGVGRMTVYRRFGGKAGLVDALAVRECRRCLTTIAASLKEPGPIAERLAALTTATLRVIHEHPLLARLARIEPAALLGELTRDGSAVFRLIHEFLFELIEQAQRRGELAGGDPSVLAELGVRVGASFVLMPESVLPLDDPAATHAAIRAVIAPLCR
ncbi:MAG: TetR/AcrR family transcriptional regulator [Solirubrobacteraceae bacterium]